MFDKTETLTLKVEGMSCGHCVKHVEEALKGLKGVKAAVVSLENQSAQVTYVPAKTGKDQMIQAVEAAGYKAV